MKWDGRGGLWGILVALQKGGSVLGAGGRREAGTIDAYAVTQMGIGENIGAVGDGERCSTSAAGGFIVLLEGGDGWLVLVS